MSHQKKNFVTKPNEHDVLYGRGRDVNFSPGNIHFRSLVEALKVDYNSATKRDKALFSAYILKTIKGSSPPGRFLKKDKRGDFLWYEVEDKEARRKIRQALREVPKYLEKLELNEEQTDGNTSNLTKEEQLNEENDENEDIKEPTICESSSVTEISKIEESISRNPEEIIDGSITNKFFIEPLHFESCLTENNGNDITEPISCEYSSAMRGISGIEESMLGTPEEAIDDNIMNVLTQPLQFDSCFTSDELSFWEQYY